MFYINYMEYKLYTLYIPSLLELKFYINYMEYKFILSCAKLSACSSFILTIWNINRSDRFNVDKIEQGFILTIWNIN